MLFSFAVMVLLALAGCGDADTPAPKAAPAKPAAKKAAPAAAKPAAGQLVVSIIPDPPTADGCIKALVSGSRQVSYRWEVSGMEVPEQMANTLCEGFKRGDEVRAVVSDDKSTGSAVVTIANAPPRITEVKVNADGIQKHADLVVTPTVVDVDDDPVELRYQWYINGEADPFLVENTLPASRYARGDAIHFTILATDGTSEGKLYQSATVTVANRPPLILSQPPARFEALEYSYQVKARDPDGDRLGYSLAKAPQGMTINRSTGLVTWPLTGVKPGAYPLRIVVRDPEGAEAFQEYTLTLGQPPSPAASAAK